MQQWDFNVLHRRGALHYIPDALSRSFEDERFIEVASFAEEVVRRDAWYNLRLRNVTTSLKKYRNWTTEDGRLYKFHTSALLDPVLSREEC